MFFLKKEEVEFLNTITALCQVVLEPIAFSQQPYQIGMIDLTLQMKKLRHRKDK